MNNPSSPSPSPSPSSSPSPLPPSLPAPAAAAAANSNSSASSSPQVPPNNNNVSPTHQHAYHPHPHQHQQHPTSSAAALSYMERQQIRLCESYQVQNSLRHVSPQWQSPEYLSGQAYGTATDVYSFGVIIWEVLTLEVPWEELGHRHPFAVTEKVRRGQRPPWPTETEWERVEEIGAPQTGTKEREVRRQLVSLAEECWRQDPQRRPKMKEVANRLQALLKEIKARPLALGAV